MSEANCKPLPQFIPNDAARFDSYVLKKDPKDCWPWLGARSPRGYGAFEMRTTTVRSCRVAYYFHYGVDPYPSLVRHTCDNSECCNPHHLILGTVKQNSQDAKERGLLATGDRNGSRLHPELLKRGSEHGMSKLTEAIVEAIRSACALGETDEIIAARHEISPSLVAQIVTGAIWKHAGGPIQEIRRHRHGADHYGAKITEDLVREIREKKATGRSYQSLADEYHLGVTTLFALCTRKTWKHVK